MTNPDRIESADTGEWTADALRNLIRKNLESGIRESGMKPDAVGDDDDLFAMGIVDSYGLVELVVAVEGATGLRADLGAENLEVEGEIDLFPSINRLCMAFMAGNGA